MRLLKSSVHPDIKDIHVSSFNRKATRAIVLNGQNILLLYTERYHDYSLPGGGIEQGEDIISGLIRELEEETGAQNVTNIQEFGLYEEFRPWYKPDYDIVHMESYCFLCNIDEVLLEPKFEAHEINNGMSPKWINIHEAINHNKKTIKHSDKKGMSIERETFLLELILKELIQPSH